VISFTPWPLFPGRKKPRYALNKRLDGSQNMSGRHGEEKILDRSGTRTPTPRPSSLYMFITSFAENRNVRVLLTRIFLDPVAFSVFLIYSRDNQKASRRCGRGRNPRRVLRN
jgi:hypothetical protein